VPKRGLNPLSFASFSTHTPLMNSTINNQTEPASNLIIETGKQTPISSCRTSKQPTTYLIGFLEMSIMGYLVNGLEMAAWKLAAHC
jgi:hypothetical protein